MSGYSLVFFSLVLPYVNMALEDVRWGILCVVAFLWVATNSAWLQRSAQAPGLLFVIGAGVVLRLVSIVWSPLPVYTAMRAVSLAVLFLFLVTYISRTKAAGRERLVAVLIVWLFGALVLAGSLLWLAGRSSVPWNGSPMWKGIDSDRFCGIFGNPNTMSSVIVIFFPLTLALWWEQKRRWWLVIVIVACLHSVALSGSRAGALGIILGGTAFFAVRYRVQWFPLAAVVLLLIGWILLGKNERTQEVIYEFATRTQMDEDANVGVADLAANRLEQWTPGWESIRNRPLLGQGYGVGGTGRSLPGGQNYGYPLHNSYLQVWQENGLVGLLLMLAVVAFILVRMLILFFGSHLATGNVIQAGFAGACIAGLGNSFFESWIVSVGNLATLPFWTSVLILCASLDAPRRTRRRVSTRLKM